MAERFGTREIHKDSIVGPGQVSVAGRSVIRDGHLQTGDLAAIRSEAEIQAKRLWQRMESF